MVKLASAFSRLESVKVMVIGDLLLDTYTIGKAKRISPEAPVAIVHVQQEEHCLGGSGNVVLNLVSLGTDTIVIGRVGKDWAGQYLCQALKEEGVNTQLVVTQENYKTPVKNRIIAENQQIVRIDHEHITPLPERLEHMIIESLPVLMHDVKIIAISDYGKGFLTSTLLSAIIGQAKELGIPVIADPKGHDFSKYQGATVIKPNLSEAYAAVNLAPLIPLETVAKKILALTQAEVLMVTRSEEGISIFDTKGERQDFPVHVKQIRDVTGAGDTVLAMLACALANRLSYAEAAQLCNIAAGIAIERIGCARITLSDLAHRLLERDISNKVFDEEHLFALQEVLKQRHFIVLALSNLEEFNQHLFQTIKQLAQYEANLLIYIIDREPNEIFIEILASLKEVNFILLHPESLQRICEKVSPLEAYMFEGRQLTKLFHFADLLT